MQLYERSIDKHNINYNPFIDDDDDDDDDSNSHIAVDKSRP